jgi:capsid assembly protease
MTILAFRTAPEAAPRYSPVQGAMRLADMLYGVWALLPDKLLEVQAIYEAHVRGDKADIQAIEARLGRPLANEQRSYEIANGVAVLGLQGVISPKVNLMSQISGGTSAQLFARNVDAAGEDPNVKSLLIAADTPGGQVLGIPASREAVRRFGARKPVVTHTDGMLASAGIWIGGAANQVFMSDAMCMVGSIGVVYTHTDTSAAEARAGVKKTVITAGKFKRAEGSDGKLSEDGMATLQGRADYVYGIFVGDIAKDYGVSTETVLKHMADGRVFIGQQAIDAGLVDGVSTLDSLIEAMATNPAKFAARRKAVVKGAASPKSRSASAARADATPTHQGDVMPGADNQTARALSQREKASKATAYAKEHGVSFVDAFKAIKLDYQPSSEEAMKERRGAALFAQAKAERVEMTREYAVKHEVDFVTAYKALGFDRSAQ